MDVETLIYGNDIEHIVASDFKNDEIHVYYEKPGEAVSHEKHKLPFFLVAAKPVTKGWTELDGDLPYKYVKKFNSKRSLWFERNANQGVDFLNIWDDREAAMMLKGFTYFKGLSPAQVSLLSFDIEATGLTHDETSKVLLISTTFRRNGQIMRKLFAYDEYECEGDMLQDFCAWVRFLNPSVLVGHNIITYDIPYLQFCAERAGVTLDLGRDGSPISFAKKPSKFRRDASQFYEYFNPHVFGRCIVDTFFLSFKYDVGRKYESYSLKNIIKQEKLEVANRQFYDASQIRFNYTNAEEWAKIKQYAIHDADDSLALYNLMIPAFFYLTRSVPKPFQTMILSNSGSQINSILIRSYLQSRHSIPKSSEASEYEGAISLGNPGVYENVFKVDVASLYPSIMLEYKVFDEEKDPLKHFLLMLSHLTKERLKNKKLAKETGDRAYKDLEGAQKIIINSCYGLLGAPGINFNSPANAARVTRIGREILIKAIEFATGKPHARS